MHKSGTTLVSQILHRSGIDMGDFDSGVSYDMGNKYERESCLRLDLELLEAPDNEILFLETPADIVLSEKQRGAMAEILASGQDRHADWGFKDPRMCLTYGLWAANLPRHKLIAVYRDPALIWPRFKWHGVRRHHTNLHRAYAFLTRWHEHNFGILRAIESTKMESLVFNYHDFMKLPFGFERLQDFVGRPLQDMRRGDLYRSERGSDVFLHAADWLLNRRRGWSVAGTMQQLAAWEHRAGKDSNA
jgi:hypothetical protein